MVQAVRRLARRQPCSQVSVLLGGGVLEVRAERLLGQESWRRRRRAGVGRRGLGESAAKAQVWGALSLYLNFINLFQLLLSLFGQREE